MQSAEFPELADDNRRIWDANARWWDDEIGDGNDSAAAHRACDRTPPASVAAGTSGMNGESRDANAAACQAVTPVFARTAACAEPSMTPGRSRTAFLMTARPFSSLDDGKLKEAVPADVLAKLEGKVMVKPPPK